MDRAALDAAYAAAARYLEGLRARPVGAAADAAAMRDALAGPLTEQGEPAAHVVEELARKADPGIVASGGPRFFGFVIGGSVPAALAADWLTSAWDQNAGLFVLSPAAAIVEETVLGWLRELFGLPEGTGMGFVTGGQMANTTCLAAARQAVLAGLRGAVGSGDGTAAAAFAGFPLDRVPVEGKTGTAQVTGRADTSLFAAVAPADNPQFAVVAVVEEAGFGSAVAAPIVRRVLEILTRR